MNKLILGAIGVIMIAVDLNFTRFKKYERGDIE